MLKPARVKDAANAVRAFIYHLSTKQFELSTAARLRRGVEGWMQHELVVAVSRCGDANILPDFGDAHRERKGDAVDLDGTEGKKRPYDLYFDHPAMAFALKVFTENRSHTQASKGIRVDLEGLARNQEYRRGVFVLARFDTRCIDPDSNETVADTRRGRHGRSWLDAAIGGAREGFRLRPLVPQAMDYDDEYVDFALGEVYRREKDRIEVHELTFGAWTVLRAA